MAEKLHLMKTGKVKTFFLSFCAVVDIVVVVVVVVVVDDDVVVV